MAWSRWAGVPLLGFAALLCAPTLAAQESPKDPSEGSTSEPVYPIPPVHESITITATPIEPTIDRRDSEVFSETLFSRDDQVFHLVNAGINVGQQEGGGKSLEVRRFGFNLDHGGVSGGLKVMVDNVQQNQTTQGHGQGYLSSLKTLSPELVQEVSIINGPFAPEYGDFSGLGVVHVRLRQALPDQWTIRLQGGSFDTFRSFVGYSPDVQRRDAFVAYEGSTTNGPFLNPLRYRRDNLSANYSSHGANGRHWGGRFNGGLIRFHSSGQIPLDEVATGRLDPYGFVDAGDGGKTRSATGSFYYRQDKEDGTVLKLDGFVSRSLWDLFSNFTFYLNDPLNGDGIQQHDSRLQEGANVQVQKPHGSGPKGLLTFGANFHDNQINVGLYPARDRVPLGVTTRANAHVTNGAGYVHEQQYLFGGRLQVGLGLRYDAFRFGVKDRVEPQLSMAAYAGRFQPKASVAFTPSFSIPATLYANYGRGISSLDARGVVRSRDGRHVATTDFYQFGTSHNLDRVSATTDFFWIDRSNEIVYIADDGSLEFFGPSRAYGFEGKVGLDITRTLSVSGGFTKVLNAFFRGTTPRVYVERAPHFVANGSLTLTNWRGWSGSVRLRAINHYRLDGLDSTILASGHTVFDMAMSRRIRSGVDLSLAVDNFTDRFFFETQNFLESRLPGQPARQRIHGTPGYPLTVTVGVTLRFGGK